MGRFGRPWQRAMQVDGSCRNTQVCAYVNLCLCIRLADGGLGVKMKRTWSQLISVKSQWEDLVLYGKVLGCFLAEVSHTGFYNNLCIGFLCDSITAESGRSYNQIA